MVVPFVDLKAQYHTLKLEGDARGRIERRVGAGSSASHDRAWHGCPGVGQTKLLLGHNQYMGKLMC